MPSILSRYLPDNTPVYRRSGDMAGTCPLGSVTQPVAGLVRTNHFVTGAEHLGPLNRVQHPMGDVAGCDF